MKSPYKVRSLVAGWMPGRGRGGVDRRKLMKAVTKYTAINHWQHCHDNHSLPDPKQVVIWGLVCSSMWLIRQWVYLGNLDLVNNQTNET